MWTHEAWRCAHLSALVRAVALQRVPTMALLAQPAHGGVD
eukprot:CAMPEP_0176126522 /NCGR_PEP_ID=MMETSP0120_2-20121206/63860_1 /TAXON_ID=160619 /ORGANISM="Kryptoperidinium foliaceum, Strain CCMP 1326" /LENGTH=39 /DNA_ID= /DNA_START= /DNA_END= /DNA_ORIENTATION=